MRQILRDIDTFVTQYNLDHIRDLLRKGAVLADDPSDLERVEGLTLDEKDILRAEKDGKASPVLHRSIRFAYIHAVLL